LEIERFKTTFAKNIFYNKYAQGANDTWDALSERVVEDVCGSRWGTDRPLMSEGDRQQLSEYIKTMKFIPGGRYLYYAGRPAKFFNNCFGSETRVLTEEGWRPIDSVGMAKILSPVDGNYYPAEFVSRGVQKLNKIVFKNVRGKQTHSWTVRATRTHHWPLVDGTDTYDLRVGDVVPANVHSAGYNSLGFLHGFIYGDGDNTGKVRVCGHKSKYLPQLSATEVSIIYPHFAHGDAVVSSRADVAWKTLPEGESAAYIASFIQGWIAADGNETCGSNKLCSVNREALEWFAKHAAYAGIVITGTLRSQVRDVCIGHYFYKDHKIYIQNYAYGEDFGGYKVVSIEEDGEEEVFCPYEPVHNRIIIDGNIDTYQCYLLRATDDTREEWANIVWRAMMCLTVGGGIGIDYCLAPETPVLCEDLTWKPVSTLKVGQNIIAFNENIQLQKGATTTATVTGTGLIQSKCFEIKTQHGVVRASHNHKFVVRKFGNHKKKGSGYNWVEAKDIKPNDEIAFSIQPWEQEDNFELGWLGGVFDGEGWLSQSKGKLSCGFAQKYNSVLTKAINLLDKYKIKYVVSINSNNGVYSVLLSGKWNILKLLSLAKPIRLLEKAGSFWEGRKLSTKISTPAIVESNTYIGIQTVVALSTSTGTLIGGGYYSHNTRIRPSGAPIRRTGGKASGPIPLMAAVNEIGRNVMQGGSRRSAIYSSLNWQHEDIPLFLSAKNWDNDIRQLKVKNFNYPAPLDMTNISVNYDDSWLNIGNRHLHPTFLQNVEQAMATGEPGFSFNFGEKQNETLRNAPLGGNTYVLLKSGYTPIKEIVGEEVVIWTGKQWAKTTFNLTKEYAETVQVELTGNKFITAEPSHEFFLADGSKVPAKDLREGQEVLVSLPDTKPFSQNPRGYTLGYVYGDGSFHKKYPRAEITFCTKESKTCVDSLDKDLISSVTLEDSRGYTRAYLKNNPMFYNRNKASFPYDILGLGEDYLCSFIAGLFDSDGNYFKDQGRVRVASKHFEFLEGVRRCLEQLGILSGISTAGISTFGQTQGYILSIYGSYVNRFAEIIPTKRLRIDSFTPYRKTKIKVISVTAGIPQDVFCCDVKVEEHSFVAEGIVVSNCTEVTSEDDSDVCNLGSINIGNIETLEEFRDVISLASRFLVCGTLRADLPYEKVYKVREKNRRLGLGLMGIHEWLLKRGRNYEVTSELKKWLAIYVEVSERSANEHCDRLFISRPAAYRAIAPTGSIGILASTTTGIEPLFAVAYKRRYLTDGTRWKYEYVVDATADYLIREIGIAPDSIETALDLSEDYERRIKFQADVQDYVDMSISSTINLPSWGSKGNNEGSIPEFARTLARYAPRLRGFTCYPDGSRGGQPLTRIDYSEALKHKGVVYDEVDICELTGGGTCGS
jgi:ribonucleotide reductase alpha subunit